ncbi:MAG: hypothetical protein ACYDH5_12185 [Acidimicrobiales bacterium]
MHLFMLAFLTTGVLGALHQFAPVVSMRSLRSERVAWATLACVVAGAWGLPAGFALHANLVVAVAGAVLTGGFLLAAWNLSGPLSARGKGAPVTGLRWSVAALVATAGFGLTYAFDRTTGEGWFKILERTVLAHAHLGLIGWLGLSYISVAEKLWPMFLLAHRPGKSPGRYAVRLVPAGVALVVTGLMVPIGAVVVAGGLVLAAGLAAHLASFAGLLRHRRRPLELLHAFVIGSACFLVAAGALAGVAGLAPLGEPLRSRLVSAEIAALAAWVGLALLGHAHKVVPFITWGVLRSNGITTAPDGKPLLFAHLFDARVAKGTWGLSVGGFAGAVVGLAAGAPAVVMVGGILLAVAGVAAVANLTSGPLLVARSGPVPQ